MPIGPIAVLVAPSVGVPRCLEAAAGNGRFVRVVRWSCTDSANQTWKRTRSDSTLRAVGRCLTFGRAGEVRPGAPVLLSACTDIPRQRVLLRGKSIRPAARPDLCVSSTATTIAAGDRLRLEPCTPSSRQRWKL